MRNIVELLELVYDELEKYTDFENGLCELIIEIFEAEILEDDELELLNNYIEEYRPSIIDSKESKEYFNEIDIYYNPKNWGWLPHFKGPRLKWLKERIQIEKKNEQD